MTSKLLCLLDEKSYLCFERRDSRDHHGYMNTFYCNSSIESKKVLININTMPMFKSPPSNPPPFPPRGKKKKKLKTKKIAAPSVAPIITWKKRQVFLIYRIFHCWQDSFLFIYGTYGAGKIMHIRRIHTSTAHCFKTLSCKANQQQHSTLKLRTQVQQGEKRDTLPAHLPNVRFPRGGNTNNVRPQRPFPTVLHSSK